MEVRGEWNRDAHGPFPERNHVAIRCDAHPACGALVTSAQRDVVGAAALDDDGVVDGHVVAAAVRDEPGVDASGLVAG